MDNAQTPQQSDTLPPNLYIERNLSLDDFMRWVRGEPPEPHTRLRSIVGPPGSGKTTFLRELRKKLQDGSVLVLWLDVTKMSSGSFNDTLHEWLEDKAEELDIPYVRDRTVSAAAAFDTFLQRMGTLRMALLVDGLDEANPIVGQQLEELISAFLFRLNKETDDRYAIVTRHDEHGLQEALLRWEDDVYSIERELSIDAFVRWVQGAPALQTHLRSIVGPPGSGKTTFMRRLRPRLVGVGCRVLGMDLGNFGGLPDGLLKWLDATIDEHEETSFVYDPTQLFSVAFVPFLRRFGSQPLVLLVDSFEDIEPDQRETLENQVFAPFLFPPGESNENRHLLIARNDEYSLREALLRWEDDVHILEGLDAVVPEGPLEQIRRRLAAVAADPLNVRAILEWEQEDSELPADAAALINALDLTGREAFAAQLADHLTPNPYVNLALLRRQLLHPERPLDAEDYRAALESYVRRAGLPADYVEILIALRERMGEHGEIKLAEFVINQRAEELEALMAAGIVAQITGRYRVEPAVLKLLQLPALAPDAATANP